MAQIDKAMQHANMLILREKDLRPEEYEDLAKSVIKICQKQDKPCFLHTFVDIAKKLKHPFIHLPMEAFLGLSMEDKAFFDRIGVSTHTVDEAVQAQKLGASYVTASHIFPTACKEGLEPRGLDYLNQVTEAVSIPVYALGGIHEDKAGLCIKAGAAGVCMMSEYMK